MQLLLIPLLVLFSLSAQSELRSYKGFESLTDDESQDIAIIPDEKNDKLEAPAQDFLQLGENLNAKLEKCKKAKAFLVFSQDPQDFIATCKDAFNSGVVDAGYILGNELMLGEWLAIDLVESNVLLEQASNQGSRLAKRALISYYTNPTSPFIDKRSAINLAEELRSTDDEWDQYILASVQASYGEREEALKGFESLISLANKGYKRATISAVLAKIKQGPLHDIEGARTLFEEADVYADSNYAFLPVMLDIVEDRLVNARQKLEKCEALNSTCASLYFNFLILGIGGPKDIWKANDSLENRYSKWPDIFVNDYVWLKATYPEAPIYDPKAALEALKDIPETKKSMPYIRDTVAAALAANGDYKGAYDLQKGILDEVAGRGLEKRYRNVEKRLHVYSSKKRWVLPLDIQYFLSGVKGFENLNEIQLEVTSL